MKNVIKCLGSAGLKIKESKCEWGRKYLMYLGHQIGSGRLAVPEHRIEAMVNYAKPKTKKHLRRFLGVIGFYRKFVGGFANMSAVLTPATSLKASHRVGWTEEMEGAFATLCKSLCDCVVLHVPVLSDVFILYTDASGVGIGACLHVLRDNVELPVAFYSRQLKGAEHRYSMTELESLAIVAAVAHFNVYLERADVTVITDHIACLALRDSKAVLYPRLRKMAGQLQGHSITIQWRPGKLMENADGLSRQSWELDDEDSL